MATCAVAVLPLMPTTPVDSIAGVSCYIWAAHSLQAPRPRVRQDLSPARVAEGWRSWQATTLASGSSSLSCLLVCGAVHTRRKLRCGKGSARKAGRQIVAQLRPESWSPLATVAVAGFTLLFLLGGLVTLEGTPVMIDSSLHHWVNVIFAETTRQVWNETSNKLDDFAQTLLWVVATVTSFQQVSRRPFESVVTLSAPAVGLSFVKVGQEALKNWFHRVRPSTIASSPSFPSAHTARFAFCAAMLLCVLRPRLNQTDSSSRTLSVYEWLLAGGLAVLIMGSTRVFADAHWFTDTLGGSCFGVAIAATMDLALVVISLFLQQRLQTSTESSPQEEKAASS